MQKLKNGIPTLLKKSLIKLNGLKFNIGFEIEFSRLTSDGNEVKQPFYMSAKVQQVLHESDISNAVNSQNSDIQQKIDWYTVGGSGWVVKKILKHYINIY